MLSGGENLFRCVCGTGALVFDGVCQKTSCLGADGEICGGNPDLCLDTRECYVAPSPDSEEEEEAPGPGPEPAPTPETPDSGTVDEEKDDKLWLIFVCCGIAILLILALVLSCCAARKRKQKKQRSGGPGSKKAIAQLKCNDLRTHVVNPDQQ